MRLVKLVYLTVLILLPLGQLARLPLSLGFSGGVYVYDLLLPLMVGAWLIWKFGVEKSFGLLPLGGLILLFGLFAGLSLLNGVRYLDNFGQLVVSWLYLWRWLMYAMLYFVGVDLLLKFPQLRSRFHQLLVGGVFFFTFAGLVQFVFFPDFSRFVKHGWDPHYYRVLSTFFDPNFAGLYLVLGFVLVAVGLLYAMNGSRKSFFYYLTGVLGLGLILLTIILTFSRSTYLSFVVGVTFLGLMRSRRLLLMVSLLGVLAFVFIPRVRQRVVGAIHLDETARIRLENYARTWRIIEDHPLLGVGFNTFRFVQEKYGYFRDERGVNQPGGHAGAGADNSFLFLWATTGIGGLAVYLLLLGEQFRLGWQRRKSREGLVLVVSLVALVVHTQFVNSLFYPWIMAWIWVLAALNEGVGVAYPRSS